MLHNEKGGVAEIVDQDLGESLGMLDELDQVEISHNVFAISADILGPCARRSTPLSVAVQFSDLVPTVAATGNKVCCDTVETFAEEISPVTDMAKLAQAAHRKRQVINRAHMENGVHIVDPNATYIDVTVAIAPGTVIHPNTYLRGSTAIAADCQIGPNVKLVDCSVEQDAVLEFVSAEASVFTEGSRAQPYSILQSGSRV